MSKPSLRVAVIMERRRLDNAWLSEKWEATGIVPDAAGPDVAPQLLVERDDSAQYLFHGLTVTLEREEAEGYYLNLTSPLPKAFVLWRPGDELPAPALVTVSYNEGARWTDSGEHVDGVPLPAEMLPWMGEFVENNYRPEPRKRKKPRYASHTDRGVGGRWNG